MDVIRHVCTGVLGSGKKTGSWPTLKKNPYSYIGVSMRTPSLFYIRCTGPQESRAGRINLESFQAQHPSRPNQPRAFTGDSIQTLVTP